jgi:predicted nucleic acid-binding protein
LGLIVDTCILIARERRGGTVDDVLQQILSVHGEIDIGISAVSVVEMTQGIFRAKTEIDRDRRRIFSRKAFHDLMVYPVTFEIAELAGRIEGEQAARGNTLAFEDLVIGATVLHLGFDVLTINLRHFQSIPNLGVVTL